MITFGQVYRDKDKRMSSGRRYVKVVSIIRRQSDSEIVKLGCSPCLPNGRIISDRTTKISPKTLIKRFEKIETAKDF